MFVREIELLFLKMNKKPNIEILKEPKGFIKGIELVSLSHIHVVLLFCILFFSFFGSDRGEYSLADNIAA